MIKLYPQQIDAVNKMKNGCILCGEVGSGKSRTALTYYYISVCQGKIKINDRGSRGEMLTPRDLYIITTAKKRDSRDWQEEASPFMLFENSESISGVKFKVDSWNNIKKYKDVYGAFFIFDEQRVVGRGSWVKAFLNIARKNQWILLSATPGDTWSDYIPVFIANGFYKNRTEFSNKHIQYARFSKYPKIERYLDEGILLKHRHEIMVNMKAVRKAKRKEYAVFCDYDKELYKIIFRDWWNPYDKEPIKESGKMCYLLRQVTNSDPSRKDKLIELLKQNKKTIIFYNFNYEREIIESVCEEMSIPYKEWNGIRHEECPEGETWSYIVQYQAASEAWNCITTNVIIFYSQNYSYRITEQAMGRIDRTNTPFDELLYFKMRSHSPIDMAIHRALIKKRDFNERRFLNRS